ncbi:MAG: NAD(P)H-dependent glycerol-3-phosphate dehydrogenase [Evtepia sp.]
MNVTVLGSGGWGTALAILLCENGNKVFLWSHNPKEAKRLEETRKNPLLPEIDISKEIILTSDFRSILESEVIVFATPSFAVRETANKIRPFLTAEKTLVSVSKGIEKETSLRLSEVIRQETELCPIVALTGPTHAEEVARHMPTACVAASENREAAEKIQDLFLNERFRVYASPDMIGAELGAAMKNVMALCTGCCTGLGYGDNTKAMIMTRGLVEIARLGVALGGKRETFAGLAGMGDLIVTCTSTNSRNYRAGVLMGQGMPVKDAIASIGAVVEGYYALDSARMLAKKVSVEMPITEAAYQVVYEGKAVETVLHELMRREKRHEIEESWV